MVETSQPATPSLMASREKRKHHSPAIPMKLTTTFLTISAAAALFGVSAFAGDGAGTASSDGSTVNPTPRRQRQAPPQASAEMKAYHERVLAIYDADKNGKLDDDERQLLREDIEAGTFERPPRPEGARGPGGRGGSGGPDGPGRMGPPKEILDQYDANKDGKLDEAERATLRADVEAGKIQPPPRPGRGPRGEGARGPQGRHGQVPPPPEADSAGADTNS